MALKTDKLIPLSIPDKSIDIDKIVITSGSNIVDINGNSVDISAQEAEKLTTARQISISGIGTGSAIFDGSSDINISLTNNHTHNLADLDEKSYNSLTDKPDLSSLHTHSNIDILNSFVENSNNSLEYKNTKIMQLAIFNTEDELFVYQQADINFFAYCLETNKLAYFDNEDSKWKYVGDNSLVRRGGYGIGPSGTYLQSWEDDDDIDVHFISDQWGDTVNGTDAGKWNRHDSPTPSGGTGTQPPYDGSYMVYAEVSSGGNDVDYELMTEYFARLVRLDFYYQLEGDNCGTFQVVILKEDGNEEVLYEVSGNQGSDWVNVLLDDLGSYGAEKLYFRYFGATGYQGDFCIDKIEITSED